MVINNAEYDFMNTFNAFCGAMFIHRVTPA